MTSDHDHLLQAILENPGDDQPRLVYADWLEENGQPERAEFVRVQVAIAKEPEALDGKGDGDVLASVSFPRGTSAPGKIERIYHKNPRHLALQARERELLNTHALSWLAAARAVEIFGSCQSWNRDARFSFTGDASVSIRRGFVFSVTLPLASLAHLSAILAANPIEEVTVSGTPREVFGVTFGIAKTETDAWKVDYPHNDPCFFESREVLIAQLPKWIARAAAPPICSIEFSTTNLRGGELSFVPPFRMPPPRD